MLFTQTYVLFIAQDSLSLSKVSLGKNPKVELLVRADWTEQTLEAMLAKIWKTHKGQYRILLSESLTYVCSFTIPSDAGNKRLAVKQRAQEQIPEDLDQTVWDFKEVFIATDTTKQEKGKVVQVVAIKAAVSALLRKALIKTQIKTATIEPESIALARAVHTDILPTLVIYQRQFPLLVLLYRGLIVTTQQLHESLQKAQLEQFAQFVIEHFTLKIQKAILCGAVTDADRTLLKSMGYKEEIQTISPAIGIAQKKMAKEKDEAMLELELFQPFSATKTATPEQSATDTTEPKTPLPDKQETKSTKRRFVLSFLFLSVLGIVGASIFFFFQNLLPPIPFFAKHTTSPKTAENKTKLTHTPTPSQTNNHQATSSQSATQKYASYPVTILNGSGIPGEASKAAELLTTHGFTVATVGNASNYTYENTQIYYNDTVPEEIQLALDKVLKTLYDSTRTEQLDEQTTTDIVIIVGKN